MTDKYSKWIAAEDVVGTDYLWITEGPWLDAEYEDTLDAALEHLDLCCLAVLDGNTKYDVENIEWIDIKQDRYLLETLLDNVDAEHRWYEDIKQQLFMATLVGA